MSDEKQKLWVEDFKKTKLDQHREDNLETIRDAGAPEEHIENIYNLAAGNIIALERAAFNYVPVDEKLMCKTIDEIGDPDKCLRLIELNPEYLAAPFAQYLIRIWRMGRYHPEEGYKEFCKDNLQKISDAILKKERDHYQPWFIAEQRKAILKKLKDKDTKNLNLKKRAQFIENTFSIKIEDMEPLPLKSAELANFITAKLYGLEPGTVKEYLKKKYNPEQQDIESYKKKMRILAGRT